MNATKLLYIIALALVLIMLLFSVGCDMSSMLEGLYPSEETNGIAETSQNVSEGQNDAVADRDQSESTTNTDDIEFVLPVNGVVTKKHDPDLQVF